MKYALVCLVLIGFAFHSCVETFNFDTSQEEDLLVVEGLISNVSQSSMQELPLDSRYFEIKLKVTNRVSNIRDKIVSGAEIQVIDETSEHWDYTEQEMGTYRLCVEDFRAEEGKRYKIRIALENGEIYESDFESLPEPTPPSELIVEEKVKEVFRVVAGEKKIREIRGLSLQMKTLADESLPADNSIYYKWDFSTTYGYIAKLNPLRSDPNYKCWITEELYYDDVVIAEGKANIEGINELFFFDSSNDEVHEGFSVLIREHAISESFHRFWEDLQNQEKQSELFAPPPYNLSTNIHSVGTEKEVFGFFGVVREDFVRWTFSSDMVSYPIIYPESLKNSCNIPMPPLYCYDCRYAQLVTDSKITNTKPTWWQD